MPELPEVQTITSDLKKHVENTLIKDVQIIGGYSTSPEGKLFTEKLKGRHITDVFRIAKNIILKIDSNEYVLIHLAMTGQVLLRIKDFKPDRWTRVVFILDKNGKEGELRFTDMRMFGKVKLINEEELEKLMEKYGLDPTKDEIPLEIFLNKLKTKRTTIKNALLDQSLLSGVGNIYATDSLWMAQIHPESKTGSLDADSAQRLLNSIKEILLESIQHRGSTLNDKMYVDIFGKIGNHQEYFRIYGKKNCPICKSKTTFKKINGRGTYFCDTCQVLLNQ